jgi:galactitol-1-phosphate 5-dehydrogenase
LACWHCSAPANWAPTASRRSINPQKLELANLGATRVQQPRDERPGDSAALEAIQFDQLVLETAGTPQTVALAIEPPVRGRSWRWSARFITI